MGSKFKREYRNWVEYRKLPSLVEVDFHWASEGLGHDYFESMDQAYRRALEAVKEAQRKGVSHVLFTHGHSTSRPGRTTARSQVRKAMRSPEATPFIIRSECIQQASVFLAVIRKMPI